MFIVAGPPGSGKSTAFPVAGFGVDFFNADDRAAALNQGSYLGIPRAVRREVNRVFEAFAQDHIERQVSCAFETTLRSTITFRPGGASQTRWLHHRDAVSGAAKLQSPSGAGQNAGRPTWTRCS
jgi:hypothetical protein